MKVWAHISACLKSGDACALVTVTRVDGSTPREAGARMIVRQDGGFYGTIGGGTLELEIIRKAAKAAFTGDAQLDLQMVSLGPDLGQCCGGRAQIAIEVLNTDALEIANHFAELETLNRPFVTQCFLSHGTLSPREVITGETECAFKINESTSTSSQILIERFGETLTPLYLFGAGHVGKALVLALAPLPFDVRWIDSRSDQFPGAVPANVTKICSSIPASILDDAKDCAFVLAMTHSHALDEEIMRRALLLQKFDFCGVIGSKTKRVRFQKRLKAAGLSDSLVSSMVCPIGVTEIKSKHPAAIAAGIAVDLLERGEARFQQAAASRRLAQQ
ncbi:MAG: xanthine dehydrogenase accessory protein XdhC [Roseibium sp.]